MRYLVEHKVHDAEIGCFKEGAIGTAVLRRKQSYDTAQDPIVRITIDRLRKKLLAYYTTEEGQRRTVRFLIEKGGYIPEFRRQETPNIAPTPDHINALSQLARWQDYLEERERSSRAFREADFQAFTEVDLPSTWLGVKQLYRDTEDTPPTLDPITSVRDTSS